MRILVLCTGNSARSQMAEGFLRSFDATLEVHSAGTSPTARVHPMAIAAMREIGIDIGTAVPKSVDRYLGTDFDLVLTVCDHAKETCPVFTGNVGRRIHVSFEDPAAAQGGGEQMARKFRMVRDEMRDRLRELCPREIRGARADDFKAVCALLAACDLPVEGVEAQFGPNYAVAERDGVLVGVAGVEVYGAYGLLRSVAVDPGRRSTGLGAALVRDRIAWAQRHALEGLYLLTTTAPDFFARIGFRGVDRESAPAEIRNAHEYRHTCPASAVVMALPLQTTP